jgi:hypothetical protein
LSRYLSPSLVIEEGEDHNAAAANPAAYADKDDNEDKEGNNNEATMPPKVKPVAAAATKKTIPNAETATLPTPSSPPSNFSVDSTDKYGIAYYCKGTQDFADVVIHVSGCLHERKYHMSIAQDGMSVLFECCIDSITQYATPRKSWQQLWGTPTPPPTIALSLTMTSPRRCFQKR